MSYERIEKIRKMVQKMHFSSVILTNRCFFHPFVGDINLQANEKSLSQYQN
jgi:hypothetical protein